MKKQFKVNIFYEILLNRELIISQFLIDWRREGGV
jgi:hypothetical protein